MSSLTRRIQIRQLKKLGWLRAPYVLKKNAHGNIVKEPVSRGGLILDSNNNPFGYRWPTQVQS